MCRRSRGRSIRGQSAAVQLGRSTGGVSGGRPNLADASRVSAATQPGARVFRANPIYERRISLAAPAEKKRPEDGYFWLLARQAVEGMGPRRRQMAVRNGRRDQP